MTATDAPPVQRTVRGSGVLLTLVGVVITGFSLTTLHWYAVDTGADSAGSGFGFRELHHLTLQFTGLPIARAYFGWLASVLLIVVLLAGTFANIPSRMTDALRLLGFLAGVGGTVVTYYAVDQLLHASSLAGGSPSVWRNSTVGLWGALLGFLIAAYGAALGPRRGPSATIGR